MAGRELWRREATRREATERALEYMGLDDIGLTLERAGAIRAYEQRCREQSPWLFDVIK